MELQLNMGGLSSFLAVPTDVVDKYLSVASGIYIKVLLAVLRANRVDTAQIAHKLSIPESDVQEAVRFWIQNGIFTESAAAKSKEAAPKQERKPRVVSTAQSLTPEEIADRIEKNADIRFLFSAAESIVGTLLTSTQQRTLIYIHEALGLPADVILMAVEYCVSIGKGNFGYIQKLCAGWADRGINTHALAEETIREQTLRRTKERQIQELLGLKDRPLTPEQQRYISNWTEKLGYDRELIQMAYERTLNAINKLSLPYMNSILNSWHEKGVRTPEDVAIKDARPSARSGVSGSGWAPSYDIEELERRGLNVPKFD